MRQGSLQAFVASLPLEMNKIQAELAVLKQAPPSAEVNARIKALGSRVIELQLEVMQRRVQGDIEQMAQRADQLAEASQKFQKSKGARSIDSLAAKPSGKAYGKAGLAATAFFVVGVVSYVVGKYGLAEKTPQQNVSEQLGAVQSEIEALRAQREGLMLQLLPFADAK